MILAAMDRPCGLESNLCWSDTGFVLKFEVVLCSAYSEVGYVHVYLVQWRGTPVYSPVRPTSVKEWQATCKHRSLWWIIVLDNLL